MSELANRNCEACRPDAPKVTQEEIETYSQAIPEWKLVHEEGLDKLKRVYKTSQYPDTLKLVNALANLAESIGHHPVMVFEFRQLTVLWWSHEMQGLHVNDFICAAKCDQVYGDIF